MKKTFSTIFAAAALTISVTGCSDNDEVQKELTLNGAGASFPAPVYQSWTHIQCKSSRNQGQLSKFGVRCRT